MEKKLYRVRVVMESVVEAESRADAAEFCGRHAEMIAGLMPPENLSVVPICQITDLKDLTAMWPFGWDKGSIPLNSSDMCIEEWLKNNAEK